VISADEKTSIQARCRCHPTTGIEPFIALVEQVMTQEPYAAADRVLWVVDNGSSHRGQKAIDRLAEQFPNAVMVHTPVHTSWLNQVEVYFSIIQRKAGEVAVLWRLSCAG
jgi:DDE superfamily endonuclease